MDLRGKYLEYASLDEESLLELRKLLDKQEYSFLSGCSFQGKPDFEFRHHKYLYFRADKRVGFFSWPQFPDSIVYAREYLEMYTEKPPIKFQFDLY